MHTDKRFDTYTHIYTHKQQEKGISVYVWGRGRRDSGLETGMGWRVMGKGWGWGGWGAQDNVLQVCVSPPPLSTPIPNLLPTLSPSLASGTALPAGATSAWGVGPSGQQGLQREGGGGGGEKERHEMDHFRTSSHDPLERRWLTRSRR